MFYLYDVSKRFKPANCLSNAERLFESDVEKCASSLPFSQFCLHPEAAFVLVSVAASLVLTLPGSACIRFLQLQLLFSPERCLCSAQPCFGPQCDWEEGEKVDRALGAG